MKNTSLILVTALSLVVFSGCKPATVSDTADFNADQAKDYESTICQNIKPGSKLNKDKNAMNGSSLESMMSLRDEAFGIVAGTSKCFGFSSLDWDDGSGTSVRHLHLAVVPDSGCMTNGGLWQVTSVFPAGSLTTYNMRLYGATETVRIETSPNLTPQDAFAKIRLTALSCQ